MEDKNKNTRRKFINSMIGIGAGSILALPLLPKLKAGVPNNTDKKKVKMLTTDGKVVEVDSDLVSTLPVNEGAAVGKKARKGIPGRSFVMVIDLARCKNARKCVEVCQEGHNLSVDQEFINVIKMQDSKETAPYWFPKPCYHCDKPSCVDVCPVQATYKRDDGTVLVDADKCIGCKYCMVACPYSARIFHWKKPEIRDEFKGMTYSPESSVPPKKGTVGKCVFCADLTRNNKLPRCVSACPEGAIYFGDKLEDTVSNGTEVHRFKKLLKDKAGYSYLEYFGTEPNVYYLPPVDRIYPFEETLKNDEA